MNKNALFDSVLWTWYEPLAKIYRTEQRKNFFPVLLPTLLTNALKIRVTLFRALKNRDVLCRNSHKVILKVAAEEKHDVSFPQKMCVPQILSLQQSELWSRPSLLPCTFMCQSSAITLRNMELKVCSSLGDFLVIAFVQAWFHVCSLKLHLRILEVFLYAQVTDLSGACTQLCQVGTAPTPSHALNPTEKYESISLCYLLNVSYREINWLYWSITHLPLLRNTCLNSCQGKSSAVWIIKTASQLATAKSEDNN